MNNETYNGIKILSTLTGISEEEIAWTWKRTKELTEQGYPKDVVKTKVARENPYKNSPVKETKFKEAIHQAIKKGKNA